MKITFIIDGLNIGGKEKQLYYLLKYLPKHIKKQLIVLSEQIMFDNISEQVDELISVKKRFKYHPGSLLGLYKSISKFSPHIVHSWDGISPLIIKPYCLLTNTKLINGSIRTSRPVKFGTKRYLLSRIRSIISDVNVSNSKCGLHILGLENKNNSYCIYNGFNLNDFDLLSNQECSHTVQIKTSFNVCMVGRFYPAKDYGTLIAALLLLNQMSDSITFHAVGEGPEIERYRELAKEYSLTNIIFHGVIKNVPLILSKCQVGILLNPGDRAEGISNAIIEYMAAELPVIATNSGGTSELVQDKISGFLVEPADAISVAEKIIFLKKNPNQSRKMGEAGRKIIQEKFSADDMVDRYLRVYHNLKN